MRVVGYILNVLLALLLVAALCASLAAGLAVVWTQDWEQHDLTEGADEATWLWIDGRPIYYWVDGPEGSPVVALIHGRQVEGLESWREVARSLSRSGMRVIAIDLVGYGHSARDPEADLTAAGQAEVVGKALNELRMADATVVGHGWGAAVALELARSQPQLVGRLGLVDPLVVATEEPVWRAVADVPYLGRAAAWAYDAGGPIWERSFRNGFRQPRRLTDEYLEAARDVSRIRGTLKTLASAGAQSRPSDLPNALGGIRQPALVTRGSHDARVTAEDVGMLARALPAARTATIEDAGFYSPLEQSARVAQLLLDWSLGRPLTGD